MSISPTVARPMSITLNIEASEAAALRSACHAVGLTCTVETKGLIFKRHEATVFAADIDSLGHHARLFLVELTRVALDQMSASA